MHLILELAVLFPTALLPSEIIQWLAIDDENAKLIANYDVISVEVDVHFKGGVIDSMRTYRYMGKEGYKEWLLNMDDYKWIKDYQIPMHLQASWRLEEKLHTYVDFYIQEIEYDV